MYKSNIIAKLINAAVFIIVEIAALAMLRNNDQLHNTWIAKGIHSVQGSVFGLTECISDYFSLKEQNRKLAHDNYLLLSELQRYKSASHPEDSLDMSKEGYTFIPAEIKKTGYNTQHNYLIINKGSEDGIENGCGLMTCNGVVGVVEAVSENYSFALSFMNTNISISARVGRDGSIGPLIWDGKTRKHAILKEIPGHIDVEKGDTVYTSGYSATFPADIPLGTVESMKTVNGATLELKILLLEDFATLRYVVAVKNDDKGELTQLEEKYENK